MKLVIYDAAWPLYVPLLRELLQTEWQIASAANDPEWLLDQIAGADALIALKLPPDMRARARNLKMLHFPGAGVMHSDPLELPEGCALCNVFEHETPIAECVFTAILLHVTRIAKYAATFRAGRWDGSGRLGGELHDEAFGKTLGLVGYGHIGRAVARRARAFGMKVLAIRGHSRREDMEHLLAKSDFLVIACPLTQRTEGMIGPRELELMQPHSFLINVSRAEVVEEAPLYEALRSGRIAGAALDVWYQYPALPGEVLHGSRLPFHELPNVLVTPHFSAWSFAMVKRRMAAIARNLDRLASGEPLERVVFTGTWKQIATMQG